MLFVIWKANHIKNQTVLVILERLKLQKAKSTILKNIVFIIFVSFILERERYSKN